MKSPVFTQLSTSLYGLTTIRAFNVQKRFETRFDAFQNDHSAAWFFYIASGRWLLFYMDLSSCIFVGGITFSMIFLIDQFNSATIGLMICKKFITNFFSNWNLFLTYFRSSLFYHVFRWFPMARILSKFFLFHLFLTYFFSKSRCMRQWTELEVQFTRWDMSEYKFKNIY